MYVYTSLENPSSVKNLMDFRDYVYRSSMQLVAQYQIHNVMHSVCSLTASCSLLVSILSVDNKLCDMSS